VTSRRGRVRVHDSRALLELAASGGPTAVTGVVTRASTSTCTEDQRRRFFETGRAMVEAQGAEAVLLAGTALALALHGFDAELPVFDCAEEHGQVIFEEAVRAERTP